MNDKKVQHMFLHVDLDAFFASVEQLDHPEYKGKPVIVGGRPEDRRGVVSTASYEARKFGVHSAMPVYQAYRLCPEGIFVHGNMRRYAEISYQVMSIFKDFSPDVQQMSIDEALIDLTGTEKLFGPADQVAMKIKERVKKETGLTVSVGLASTQYIAKIASGYSKPDGFYYVHPGDETDFMLSLPLDKIWGAGKKTQELIKLKGIKTTRDIYEKDLDLLQFMFGPNLGSFLYNAVRGNEDLSFSHEAKKHSISAETTFPYDITDIYTAETTLMELCYGVYFRLLRDESFSRTVTLKLRYDDFTTTNAQVTYDRNIMSLDSFFEKIKALFESKYENGRGIRLLGVGFDNVETEDRPYQQDLFETDNTKKTKIEKAILDLNKKHPEIKVQKARMLKNNLITIFTALGILISTALFPSKAYAKDNSTESTGAATLLPQSQEKANNDKIGKQLFNWDINDNNNLEFLVSGYWKASFEDNVAFSFGNNSAAVFNAGVPIFKQEIDLSFSAILNNTWFFKADFADEFTKNTISLGYKGNGYFKSALISNRNITMPDFYAASYFGYGISGGDSQSPGFNMHFEDCVNNLWSGDFLIRYDMTQAKNATFYGLNNVQDSYIAINKFEYGRTFVFPKEKWDNLSKIDGVYVENKSGTYKDGNGKSYKKLSFDQYLIQSSSGKLLLAANALSGISSTSGSTNIPTVLITFSDNSTASQIITALGSYSASSTYLGKIQTLFDNINLADFSYKLTNTIDNKSALVIQNTSGFSPFLVCQTYDCGIIKDADIYVVSKTSDIHSSDFKTEITDDEASTTITNFFSENHKYLKVFSTSSSSADLQEPINRYPFALTNPEIYLNLEPQTDTSILIRTYSKVSSLNIGTSAIAGTVQVYKNGVLDIGAKFDETTGNVNLSSAVESTDKIYITWQEDSSDFVGGAIVAGAGFNYIFNPKLKANLAITSRWPVTPFRKYSTTDSIQKSFTAISSGVDYTSEHFSVSDKLSLAMENQNGTGALLVSSHNENLNKTYYLSSSSGYATLTSPVLNTTTKLELLPENNCTVTLHAAQTEVNSITGYKIPLDFNFNKGDSNQNCWAAVDIQLSAGNLLKKSSQVEIALKNASDMSGYDFYIQLGVNASKSFYGEDREQIPTWKINDTNTDGLFDFSSLDWQTVTLQLDDISRSKLTSYHDARLIIVKRPGVPAKPGKTETVYFGPYEPYTQLVFTKANSNAVIFTQSTSNNSPSASELLISTNYSTVVNWNYITDPLATENTKIISVNYFEAADFSNYKTVNFDFAYLKSSEKTAAGSSGENQFELILDNSAKNLEDNGNIALKVQIKDISACIKSELSFHTLAVDINSNQVYLDKELLPSSAYSVEINKNIVPDRQKITIETNINNTLISKGAFYIDNLYYKETSPALIAQNNINLSYNYKDTIVKVNNYDLIKNFEVNLNSTQSAQTLISQENKNSAQANGNVKAGITLADINFVADASIQSAENPDKILKNAGHNIKSEKPLFKVLSLTETYRFSVTDSSLKKTDSATLDFSNIKVPLKLTFDANSAVGSGIQNQNVTFDLNVNPTFKENGITFQTSLKANQKINQLISKAYSNTQNYFQGYYDISALEFSTGDSNAQNRNVDFSSKIGASLNWIKLSPSLEYNLASKYTNSSETTLNDSHVIKFNVPFTLSNNSFAFTYTKTGIGEQNTASTGNYISDSQKLFDDFNKRSYFYTSIPFYDLFDSDISGKLNQNGNFSNSLSSKYEILWKRKLANSFTDLFIPSATSFAISRDLKYSDQLSDLYQMKAVLTNNAINIFGSKSRLKTFKWYEHEELQSSLTGIVKIPNGQPEATTFQTTLYSQIIFFISDRNTLQTGIDFSLETNLDWSARSTVIWQYPGKTTFIIPLLNLIKPIAESNPKWKITRKDSVNIQIGRKNLVNNQLYEIYHNMDLNFYDYYTVTAGVGLNFNYVENSTNTLSLKFNIGGKMQF